MLSQNKATRGTLSFPQSAVPNPQSAFSTMPCLLMCKHGKFPVAHPLK